MSGLTRRRFLGLAGMGLVSAGLPTPRAAHASIFGEAGVTYAFHGRAIRGVDVVAYHTHGKVMDGSDGHVTVWRDAMWCFASAENQSLFEADPRAFAPQYGGYCSFSMALNRADASDPMAWQILGGKLFLYSSVRARQLWDQDASGNIARADANWPVIMHELAG